jgi:hypothetical protein
VLEALIEATYTKERTQHLRRANLGIENQNMIAGRSQLPSFSSACCATASNRDGG